MEFINGHLERWFSDSENADNSRYDLILDVDTFPVVTSPFIRIQVNASQSLYYAEDNGWVSYFLHNTPTEEDNFSYILNIALKEGHIEEVKGFQNCSYPLIQSVLHVPVVPVHLQDTYGNEIEHICTYLHAIDIATKLNTKIEHKVALRKIIYPDNSFYFEFAPAKCSGQLFRRSCLA